MPSDRDQLRDLTAMLALPFVWRDLAPEAVCEQLVDLAARLARTASVRVSFACAGYAATTRARGGDSACGGGVELAVDREDLRLTLACRCSRAGFPTQAERALLRAALDQAWLSIRMSILTETLRRSNKSKDDFLAMLSHELRTPLNAMLGWASMLRAGNVAPERQRAAIETIERNARVQKKLVDDLLDLSRIVNGKLALDASELELGSLLGLLVESSRIEAAQKGVTLELACAEPGPIVRGDAIRLEQAFGNLIANAVKLTPAGGRVRVRAVEAVGTVRVAVEDTGPGIEAAMLGRIFDPFLQVGAPALRAGGLGLGLAIVKHLVELHGGTVEAESPGEGGGATFTIRLPTIGRREQHPAAIANGASLEGARFLVVDDDEDAREVATNFLEIAGGSADSVGSVEAALARLEVHRPDAVLCDIAMPGKDGYELVRQLRADDRYRSLPVIALTALAARDDHQRALAAGFDAHLGKPIDAEALFAVIRRVIDRD